MIETIRSVISQTGMFSGSRTSRAVWLPGEAYMTRQVRGKGKA